MANAPNFAVARLATGALLARACGWPLVMTAVFGRCPQPIQPVARDDLLGLIGLMLVVFATLVIPTFMR